MKEFSLLIKPASADCNMNCRYCFYLKKSSLYPEDKVHRMKDDTLERLISSYMKTSQNCYIFGWQGGEPTLMGVEFYRKVVELQKIYGDCLKHRNFIPDSSKKLSSMCSGWKMFYKHSLDFFKEIADGFKNSND